MNDKKRTAYLMGIAEVYADGLIANWSRDPAKCAIQAGLDLQEMVAFERYRPEWMQDVAKIIGANLIKVEEIREFTAHVGIELLERASKL